MKLGKHGGDRRSTEARKQAAISGLKLHHGTDKASTVARLRRDNPELAEQVIAGESELARLAVLPSTFAATQ